MVVILHLNGWLLTDDLPSVWIKEGLDRQIQVVIQSMTIICVNCFLVITGWYGVKLKFSSIWKIWSMIVCIYVPFQVIDIVVTGHEFSLIETVTHVVALVKEDYFVQCYLMLVFFSPFLNLWAESQKKQLLYYALTFWAIEVVMSCLWKNSCLSINNGFSLFHFMMMYLLARSLCYHQDVILKIKKRFWMMGYVVCVMLLCVLHNLHYTRTYAYSNPLVVIESFCLFFPFLHYHFVNRWINWVAASTFAVYVVHMRHPLIDWLKEVNIHCLSTMPYDTYLAFMVAFAVLIFSACIAYDKLRIALLGRPLHRLGSLLEQKLAVKTRE